MGVLKRQIVLNVYMFERQLNYLSFGNNFIILLQLQRYETMRENNRDRNSNAILAGRNYILAVDEVKKA